MLTTKAHQMKPLASSAQDADVLLVEEDSHDAELTIRALEECGCTHRVEHVTDGEEALDYLNSLTLFANWHTVNIPRLIVVDVNLHNAGGLHLLRQLRADERTRSIPIIVLTASRLATEIVESHHLGVNSYVLKPLDAPEFSETVAAIGRYWLSVNEPPPH